MTTQGILQTLRSNLLRYSLEADGAFCITSGLILLAGATPLASLIGLAEPVALQGLGAILIVYGIVMIRYAASEPANRRLAGVAAALNVIWVLLSVAGLLFGWFPVTTAGRWAIALVAEVVLFYAILQVYALWRTRH
ncbi:MAG: hypothetical protein D6791_16875 [Chloroflexi bacterium]|nr:MAG: hypothetical protein D6791_16875 [Chloroflexota bacterium]